VILRMRQILFILSILVILLSCKNDIQKNSSIYKNNSAHTEDIDFDADFKKWLNKLDIDPDNIIDTTRKRAFELWSYKFELTKSDSALYWYPSKDSSYYLITNFNNSTKARITKEHSKDINLQFLNRNNDEVYIGMSLLDSVEEQSIDFYWYDSNTFFFVANPNENKERMLIKLKMEIDSIWTHSISISKLDERSDGKY